MIAPKFLSRLQILTILPLLFSESRCDTIQRWDDEWPWNRRTTTPAYDYYIPSSHDDDSSLVIAILVPACFAVVILIICRKYLCKNECCPSSSTDTTSPTIIHAPRRARPFSITSETSTRTVRFSTPPIHPTRMEFNAPTDEPTPFSGNSNSRTNDLGLETGTEGVRFLNSSNQTRNFSSRYSTIWPTTNYSCIQEMEQTRGYSAVPSAGNFEFSSVDDLRMEQVSPEDERTTLQNADINSRIHNIPLSSRSERTSFVDTSMNLRINDMSFEGRGERTSFSDNIINSRPNYVFENRVERTPIADITINSRTNNLPFSNRAARTSFVDTIMNSRTNDMPSQSRSERTSFADTTINSVSIDMLLGSRVERTSYVDTSINSRTDDILFETGTDRRSFADRSSREFRNFDFSLSSNLLKTNDHWKADSDQPPNYSVATSSDGSEQHKNFAEVNQESFLETPPPTYEDSAIPKF